MIRQLRNFVFETGDYTRSWILSEMAMFANYGQRDREVAPPWNELSHAKKALDVGE